MKETTKTPLAVHMTLKPLSNEIKVQSTETFKTLLPVSQIKNLTDAGAILQMAVTLDNRVGYAKARALKIVSDNPSWVTEAGYKSVITWAQAQYGVKEIQARNYLKSAEYIRPDATETVFTWKDKAPLIDFPISVLAEAFAPSKLSIKEIQDLINCGKITVNMNTKTIIKELKKLNAKDIDNGAETTTDGAETTTDGAETTTDGAEKVEKVETIKVSFNPKTAEEIYSRIPYNEDETHTHIKLEDIPQSAYILIVYNNTVTKVYQNKGNTAE